MLEKNILIIDYNIIIFYHYNNLLLFFFLIIIIIIIIIIINNLLIQNSGDARRDASALGSGSSYELGRSPWRGDCGGGASWAA